MVDYDGGRVADIEDRDAGPHGSSACHNGSESDRREAATASYSVERTVCNDGALSCAAAISTTSHGRARSALHDASRCHSAAAMLSTPAESHQRAPHRMLPKPVDQRQREVPRRHPQRQRDRNRQHAGRNLQLALRAHNTDGAA